MRSIRRVKRGAPRKPRAARRMRPGGDRKQLGNPRRRKKIMAKRKKLTGSPDARKARIAKRRALKAKRGAARGIKEVGGAGPKRPMNARKAAKMKARKLRGGRGRMGLKGMRAKRAAKMAARKEARASRGRKPRNRGVEKVTRAMSKRDAASKRDRSKPGKYQGRQAKRTPKNSTKRPAVKQVRGGKRPMKPSRKPMASKVEPTGEPKSQIQNAAPGMYGKGTKISYGKYTAPKMAQYKKGSGKAPGMFSHSKTNISKHMSKSKNK